MPDAAITIVGGGVIGLAIAAELAPRYSPLFVLERNPRYGQETSARNSEVIHAGIYYPEGSLKAQLCVEGRELLYDLCERNGVPYRRITKIITATKKEEEAELERLYAVGTANGAPLRRLTAAEVLAMEPHIVTVGGLLSSSTGIISAHGLMDYFYHAIRGPLVPVAQAPDDGRERGARNRADPLALDISVIVPQKARRRQAVAEVHRARRGFHPVREQILLQALRSVSFPCSPVRGHDLNLQPRTFNGPSRRRTFAPGMITAGGYPEDSTQQRNWIVRSHTVYRRVPCSAPSPFLFPQEHAALF